MRQEAKPITSKAILKRPNLETIEKDQEENNVNLSLLIICKTWKEFYSSIMRYRYANISMY